MRVKKCKMREIKLKKHLEEQNVCRKNPVKVQEKVTRLR